MPSTPSTVSEAPAATNGPAGDHATRHACSPEIRTTSEPSGRIVKMPPRAPPAATPDDEPRPIGRPVDIDVARVRPVCDGARLRRRDVDDAKVRAVVGEHRVGEPRAVVGERTTSEVEGTPEGVDRDRVGSRRSRRDEGGHPGRPAISCAQAACVRSGDQSQSTARGPPGGVSGVSMPRSIVVTVVGGGHVPDPSTNQIRAPAGSPVATGSDSEGAASDPRRTPCSRPRSGAKRSRR